MSGSATLTGTSAGASTSTAKRSSKSKARSSTAKKSRRPPLGKLLASNEVEVRNAAVETLLDFLAGKDAEEGSDVEQKQEEAVEEPEWDAVKLPKAFREDNMMILWQGCFYCMYMCDKPLPQQKLANQLAEPLLSILENPKLKSKTARLQAALSYLSIFWTTMVREWPGIDKHRVDKYYSLMRRMLSTTFKLLRETGWNARAMEEVCKILTRPGGPIHLQDTKTPISVAYHVIDIYVEEIERSLEDREDDTIPAPLLDLLQPFIEVLSATANKAPFQRILANVLDPVLDEVQAEEARRSKRRKTDLTDLTLEKALANQKEGLDQAILKRLFEKGAEETTDDVARKRLYTYASKRGYEGDE